MDKLDNQSIEIMAVNAIETAIASSPFLQPYISKNDKEPSWDGSVYIYNTRNNKVKSNLKGRLPVQVKGKQVNDLSNNKTTFPISISDLHNYLNDGGVIFFLVHIENVKSNKIYYIELTPVRIKMALNKRKNKTSYTFDLKEFPENEEKKASIFFNCFDHCHKQKSFSESMPYLLDDEEKLKEFDRISLKVTSVGNLDPVDVILTSDVYMYLEDENYNIPVPVDDIPVINSMSTTIKARVMIKEKVFYQKVRFIREADKSMIKIGESFTLDFCDYNPVKFEYKPSSSIRMLCKDLNFFISFFENKKFYINNIEFPLPDNCITIEKIDEEIIRDQLCFAQKCVQVLDYLNCKGDLNYFELNSEEIKNINRLWDSLIEGNTIKNLRTDLPNSMKLIIQNLIFLVNFEKKPGYADDEYDITDFFTHNNIEVGYKGTDGKIYSTSRFEWLTEEDLLEVCNFNSEHVLQSFKEINNNGIYTRGNFFLLKLLNAYDKSNGTKVEILTLAEHFIDWLKEYKDEIGNDVLLINELQIFKRYRNLTELEKQRLWDVINNNYENYFIQAGAYILLDQSIPTENCLRKMSEVEFKEFKEYPIYNLYERNFN